MGHLQRVACGRDRGAGAPCAGRIGIAGRLGLVLVVAVDRRACKRASEHCVAAREQVGGQCALPVHACGWGGGLLGLSPGGAGGAGGPGGGAGGVGGPGGAAAQQVWHGPASGMAKEEGGGTISRLILRDPGETSVGCGIGCGSQGAGLLLNCAQPRTSPQEAAPGLGMRGACRVRRWAGVARVCALLGQAGGGRRGRKRVLPRGVSVSAAIRTRRRAPRAPTGKPQQFEARVRAPAPAAAPPPKTVRSPRRRLR